MSLLSFWKSDRAAIESKRVEQLVALAGNGQLRENSESSAEFREYLRAVETPMLGRYVSECLSDSFKDSGLVLQDLVNELGRRLGYDVEDGRYRGHTKHIGFDGIWKLAPEPELMIEVKTTDVYAMSLDTIAGYRHALIKDARLSDRSSILLVVGRNDTDVLEAQVRGSRHAWDIRIISVSHLMKLVELKESADNASTIKKFRDVLRPRELTRVDFIVDLLATTADDIKDEGASEAPNGRTIDTAPATEPAAEKRFTPVAFHGELVHRLHAALGVELRRETRSLYITPDQATSVRIVASKPYAGNATTYYWYAFHLHYLDVVGKYPSNKIAFGCGGADTVLLFDLVELERLLPRMNTTETEGGRTYWHVHLVRRADGQVHLRLKGGETLDVSERALQR